MLWRYGYEACSNLYSLSNLLTFPLTIGRKQLVLLPAQHHQVLPLIEHTRARICHSVRNLQHPNKKSVRRVKLLKAHLYYFVSERLSRLGKHQRDIKCRLHVHSKKTG